jgi:hypothetical protein
MKKEELKKILKPLIKECIKEVIFEDGTLSTIISEVAVGLGSTPKQTFVETKKKDNKKIIEQRRKKDLERRRKLLDAAGRESYNGVDLFEGTTAMDTARSPNSTSAPGALAGVDPRDAGVDISSLVGASPSWKKIIGN